MCDQNLSHATSLDKGHNSLKEILVWKITAAAPVSVMILG